MRIKATNLPSSSTMPALEAPKTDKKSEPEVVAKADAPPELTPPPALDAPPSLDDALPPPKLNWLLCAIALYGRADPP